jgi:CHASE2 domain-containing sensor protein
MALRQHRLFRPAVGAGLTVFCGLVLWGTEGGSWVNASYDYLFKFCSRSPTDQVVLIQMDNDSYDYYHQHRESPWDRDLHAKLLNRLAKDGCRLVVFDTWFEDPSDPSKDRALEDGLQSQHGVVLAMELKYAATRYAKSGVPDYDIVNLPPLLGKFLKATNTTAGIAWLERDADGIVRRHWPFLAPSDVTSLAWSAALAEGARPGPGPQERWLRYYNQSGSCALLNYRQAENQVAGYFTNKIVFIGSKPETPDPFPVVDDKFSTPYTRWTGEAVGGVEILATEFLNLVNGDWLRRPAWWVELGVLIAGGLLLGAGLGQMRPARACVLAICIAAVVSLAAICLTQWMNYWFPWLVVAGGQTPCALAWALIGAKLSPREAAVSNKASAAVVLKEEPAQLASSSGLPDSDDYEIFHALGEGSFGKVWLARNAVNQWQALKAVYLAKFGSNTKPYEREFNGIRRYKPISDKHPGLLRIDFVSTKKKQGYFYYVMELGDALEPGWEQTPQTYKPKDLAKLLARTERRRLPAPECLRIAILLAEALDYLHSQSLTHGDVKPQNIIFVNDQPKLADVGLVKELAGPEQTRTGPCTPAYMAPGEAPGTAQADIYALGMVLYVMFMGHEPESFPAIGTTVVNGADPGEFVRVNSVILRACHPDSLQRYRSAREMAEALRQVQTALESPLDAAAE